jgi:predicted RNA-binding protein with RPS1 domain
MAVAKRAAFAATVGCLLVLSALHSYTTRYFAPALQQQGVTGQDFLVPRAYPINAGAPPAQQVYSVQQSGAGPVGSVGYFLACCAVLGVSYRVAAAAFSGSHARSSRRSMSPTMQMLSPDYNIMDKHMDMNEQNMQELEIDFDDFEEEGYEDFEAVFNGENTERLNRGTSIMGTVTRISESNDAFVDINYKAEGVISLDEATLGGEMIENMGEILTPGEEYEFQITGGTRRDGSLCLSRKPFLTELAWAKVEDFTKDGKSFMATIIGSNAGGVIATHPNLGGLVGFIPGSMISSTISKTMSDGQYNNDDLVGTELEVKIHNVDKENNRLVLSNRAAVVAKAMGEIQLNSLVEGTVVSIMNFGVFVDVLGIRGMIHVSQVSALFVDPALMEKLLPIGSKVKCVVVSTDFANGKLGLSTRLLESSAGEIRLNPEKVFANAEERIKELQEKWKLEEEAKERERRELESTIMDLTMSVFDNEETAAASTEEATV